MNSAILRRLAALQAFAARQRPAQVVICFTDGTATVTTPGGALDAFCVRGTAEKIDRFQSDSPVYGPWAQLLTVLLHPVPDRRIEDYEA